MHEKHNQENTRVGRIERRKILLLGNEDLFPEDVVNYAIDLAERLDYDILALNVNDTKLSTTSSQRYLRQRFEDRAAQSAKIIKHKAAQRGVQCEHEVKFTDPESAVKELNHAVKRIEFIVMPSELNGEEVARMVSVPVFSVASKSTGQKGGKNMADDLVLRKKRPVGLTIGCGLLSAALYAAVFSNVGTVMQYFTKGGIYAALPIATVFVFSFAHGAFASNLWTLLGIEAFKRDALRETEKKVVRKRKQARKRPRAYAYVNPFHRI